MSHLNNKYISSVILGKIFKQKVLLQWKNHMEGVQRPIFAKIALRSSLKLGSCNVGNQLYHHPTASSLITCV